MLLRCSDFLLLHYQQNLDFLLHLLQPDSGHLPLLQDLYPSVNQLLRHLLFRSEQRSLHFLLEHSALLPSRFGFLLFHLLGQQLNRQTLHFPRLDSGFLLLHFSLHRFDPQVAQLLLRCSDFLLLHYQQNLNFLLHLLQPDSEHLPLLPDLYPSVNQLLRHLLFHPEQRSLHFLLEHSALLPSRFGFLLFHLLAQRLNRRILHFPGLDSDFLLLRFPRHRFDSQVAQLLLRCSDFLLLHCQ